MSRDSIDLPPPAAVHASYFLVGPTAAGKSALAQRLAARQGMNILSADSMVIYRGMDVGTDKPSAAMRAEIRYWGVDLVTPDCTFSVGAYLAHARQAFAQSAAAGRALLVVGGTGLYVKCLLNGLDPLPPADAALRAEAAHLLAERGVPALQERLGAEDPDALDRLKDPRNPRRLIRALEIARTRASPATRPARAESQPPLVGLRMTSADLHRRIVERVDWMYGHGLLEETRRLRETTPALSETARHAIGYREAAAVLDGTLTVEKAKQSTVTRTRQLAKRQMTWFRRQARVCWIDARPDSDPDELAGTVLGLWKQYGPTPLHN